MKNFRLGTAFLVVFTLNFSLTSVFALPNTDSKPHVSTGIMSIAGTVTVDGANATSGQTLFTGSRIAIAENSQSIIDLGASTRFVLASETDLGLDFSRTSVASSLDRGKLRGFIPAGLPLTVKTAGAELVSDSSQPLAFTVQVEGDITKVTVEKGRLAVRTGERMQSVSAGQVFSIAPGFPGQTEPPDDDDDKKKIGILVAIGAAAAILAVVLIGKDDPEDEFGDCVIILSGEGNTCT